MRFPSTALEENLDDEAIEETLEQIKVIEEILPNSQDNLVRETAK